ncbi:MAG TPA: membrane protein insertase YidC [Solimonas sp.]|nr:membrane protein insertase YidC [Solimonas sp.]
MENRRFILLALLGVVLFFMYQAWKKDYAEQPAPPPAQAAVATDDTPVPSAAADDIPTAGAPAAGNPAAAAPASAAPVRRPGEVVHVETDVLIAEIALDGGELRRLELKAYPRSKAHPEAGMPLFDNREGHYFVLQSGLAGTEAPLATHRTAFTSTQHNYSLEPGAATLDVALDYEDPSGYAVRKVYRFGRGSYEIGVLHQLDNKRESELAASPYARLVRTEYKSGDEPPFVATFTGVGFYEQKDSGGYRFLKTKLDDLPEKPFEKSQKGGWIAMLQHYFVVALLPGPDEAATYSARPAKEQGYMAQYVGPTVKVPAHAQHEFSTRLYAGPKLQDRIGKVAPGLELTVDYGILTPIAEPLFWLLEQFYKLTRNWGFAIILLTIAVKGAMYKLSEAQYRSMAKMKKFSPKIQELKERYGDDRERMQKAMMELYKKEGFNPLAGCWPLLVQFPVFISLYWVLLESVEMRQAPFALWIQDLSAPDPYFVLPVLFGISMFLQQKLSGQQMPDPMQQKVMNVMPIMLTAFFAFFQSGLVLYWFVSNLIGISQQWYITRKLEAQGLAAPRAAR